MGFALGRDFTFADVAGAGSRAVSACRAGTTAGRTRAGAGSTWADGATGREGGFAFCPSEAWETVGGETVAAETVG